MNFFQISPKLYELVQTCIKLYELVQIGQNLSELVQTCTKIIFRKPQKPTNFWWSQHSDTFMTETDFLLIQRKTEINHLLLRPPQLMILIQNIIFIGKNGLLEMWYLDTWIYRPFDYPSIWIRKELKYPNMQKSWEIQVSGYFEVSNYPLILMDNLTFFWLITKKS